MSTQRIIDLAAKSPDIKETEMPAALIYLGERAPVRDWQELFFVAVKCLYTEFPDTINDLCSTDPSRMLFLRTNSLDMISPRKIAPLIFLETQRTPKQIVRALKLIFNRANVRNIQMRLEVYEPLYPFTPPSAEPPPPRRPRNQKPVLHLNQTIEEMLATLDAMEVMENRTPSKSAAIASHTFGNLFFVLEGERYGPFDNEKNRYVALMQCLAELYPYQILKEAGHHINSAHRLTLMKGASYLYFREPVELPNNLYIDKDFPDRILVENERYYLACCGLYFERVMFSG